MTIPFLSKEKKKERAKRCEYKRKELFMTIPFLSLKKKKERANTKGRKSE